MANMIKFYKGLEASLPNVGVNGALYITTDEGGIYLGTGTGMKRLGDFVQVDNVDSLPASAHESCLYYCVAENILAKWNGTEWKQINKQPTAEELKTLLGLGSMAYKSEVAEADLNDALKAKVNAAAEGNHAHSNKTVLDGISAEKVTAWDAAEKNAKDYADGLNTAMNTRVEALEAIDHEHANKALLDTYTQTEADLADAVAKKHAHTNADELAKIADGDKAKWDAVAADHLTADDKTALENSIKDAKKAGTDANTALESYKVTNDARVKDVEDDIADINDTTNGILAQAKTYADGKDSAIAVAKSAADKVQEEVDALETYVGTIPTDYDETNVISYINKKAEETLAAAQGGSSETAASVKQQLDNYKSTNDTRVKAAEDAIALKADKSVVDAMYTNVQIDGFIADAKKYADDNDADTKYGIVYDSENKKIKLVEGSTNVEIDASAFIKDGMINTVTIDKNDDLIITFNTDAGKEDIVLPLDQLVDIYTGVEGARVKVTVNDDKSISADIVAGSITKDYLDANVKASLALADSAIQAHQDISHLATTAALNGVDAKFANYTNTTDMNAKFELKADKTQVATDIATAKSGAETKAAELDATLKTELQKEIDNDVKALADTVYTKTEVDALMAWGEF